MVVVLGHVSGRSAIRVEAAGALQDAAPARRANASPAVDPTLINQYCVGCHNSRSKIGGLALDQLDLSNVPRDAEVWEKVIRKLRSGAMPPAGRPRPEPAATAAFVTHLETTIDGAARQSLNPGRKPSVHRLNRAEYANAVRDLLGIDLEMIGAEKLLPADDTGYGFDNIADVLSMSPLLLERYLSAARRISAAAVGEVSQPVSRFYDVRKQLRQDDRMSEALPFDSRGGLAVRHYFPVDGEYVIKIRMLRTYEGKIRGLDDQNELEVRVNRTIVKQFTIGGDVPGKAGARESQPPRRPPGFRDQRRPQNVQYLMGADSGLEFRVAAKAGPALIGVSYVRRGSAAEGILAPRYPVTSYEYAGDTSVLAGVEQLEIVGPYNAIGPGESPSRQLIFSCHPDAKASQLGCARTILTRLARRAYRRPITEDDLAPLFELYDTAASEKGFDAGIQVALERILASPDFLFRIERDPAERPGVPHRISNVELASRLSFFLWSTIPDEPLLDAAIRGKLADPAILREQVRRMLGDSRTSALSSNFGGQWLQLRNVRFATPDPITFPEFDENLRDAMLGETELFVDSQLRDDRSVPELLTADYTFLNERLARHYRVDNVYGSHFRRVTVTDPARRGLLGQAAILMVTSYPNRTAPTIRGKWLLENVLGAPPPPPPPNVPALKDPAANATPLPMRARLEQHRTNPVCASCHARMDPLGFALENFDAIGAWRGSEGGTRVDASATLPDGTSFAGPAGLRELLLKDREEFVRTVAEKLLTYALGRGVEYYDQPAIRQIVQNARANEYRWSALILGVIESVPFQMRLPATAASAP